MALSFLLQDCLTSHAARAPATGGCTWEQGLHQAVDAIYILLLMQADSCQEKQPHKQTLWPNQGPLTPLQKRLMLPESEGGSAQPNLIPLALWLMGLHACS